MDTILSHVRNASRDPRDCRATIDALRGMGFGEEAFRRLHQFRASLAGFYGYTKKVRLFKDDDSNHRVHQRFMFVLLSCSNGAPPKGRSFEALAEEAYRLIPPL